MIQPAERDLPRRVDTTRGVESSPLWRHFQRFAENTDGHDATYVGPTGQPRRVHYFDWTASGRLYRPIEAAMSTQFGPLIANTHTESSRTGEETTAAYHYARERIKTHVNADPDRDVLIVTGSGATGAVNKLQRILGLKVEDQINKFHAFTGIEPQGQVFSQADRPVVFVTHMEHHSNQTSWLETDADVVVVPSGENGTVDPDKLKELLDRYSKRKVKIGAFTAASNVTGIKTPLAELAKTMHEEGGYAFFDYAAAAPYVDIDMNPEDPAEKPDAIYFSPHKFLGGPGTPGILLLDKKLYPDGPPDHPGGGTVAWTNPWGGRRYIGDLEPEMTVPAIEAREDGGTPPFLNTIKAALAMDLKAEMDLQLMQEREEHLVTMFMDGLEEIDGFDALVPNNRNRLGIVSFRTDRLDLQYNLVVKMLSDEYGIQTRGGCSCAGTYGHELFNITEPEQSQSLTDQIDHGDHTRKPGWVRVSLHPTNSDEQVAYLLGALKEIAVNGQTTKQNYTYDKATNEWTHNDANPHDIHQRVAQKFAAVRETLTRE